MKRVWKITLWTTGVLGFLMVIAAGLLYWKLTSMDLGDIVERHLAQTEQTAEGAEPGDPAGAGEADGGGSGGGGQLPASLSGAVSKADTLADKPIQSDDALGAAAILLQSGLSFREMYYLMGKSTDTLSTEEKQNIRDMLLAKLRPEEIEALRAITSEYGKNLVILDPDYPIEAVGVKDDAERDRIIYEYRQAQKQANQPAQGSSQPPGASAGQGPDSSPVEPADKPSPTSQSAEASEPPAPAADGASAGASSAPEPSGQSADAASVRQTPEQRQAAGKPNAEQLTASYHKQLQTLKASCVAEAEQMLGSILSLLDQADGVSMTGAAEQDMMEQVSEAEQRCDREYERLIAQAESEFAKAKLSFAAGKKWDQEYEQTKATIRERATSRIQAKM
ncbi:hypothetical protein [Paenibacillus sp. 1P07SE]|uniref:hypothetical protein n=1 Tax=Paenibacillus sp. 1P07SE TaxID=3132209 RepID=UPI0039A77165